MRNVTVQIRNPNLGDTYDIYVAPTGQPLEKTGTGTADVYLVVVPNLIVGQTYDFADIVHRGGAQSLMSNPKQYTVTQAQMQRIGLGPKKKVDHKGKQH
jgi:hypothetical protein